jgi:hypothetical protein
LVQWDHMAFRFRTKNSKRPTGYSWGLVLLALVALPLLGCAKNGSECDTCMSDADCKMGTFCSSFNDGSKRCGSGTGATQCRVR